MISAEDGLRLLQEGNDRFVSGARRAGRPVSQAERLKWVSGQEPFAVVLGCADSRVPVELIFDQGVGDLFVVRVAGNIVGPSSLGSIEFAVSYVGSRLVVVLGHTGCGAVEAALKELAGRVEESTPAWSSITARIHPSIDALPSTEFQDDWSKLYQHAIRANINASVRQLKDESNVLRSLMEEDGLKVVGAEYSLETGVVKFLEGS